MTDMLVATLLVAAMSAPATTPVEVHRNPDSGQISWAFEDNGFGFQLIQLHPDYVAAFYGARGLSKEVVLHMAAQCVFGTIIRNLSDKPLHYRVAEWQYVTANAKPRSVTTKSDWVAKWQGMGTAFKWSLLPDDQVFAVGDWHQGFTTVDLPHGTRFDLRVVWHVDGTRYEKEIKEVSCASAP